MSCCSVPNCNKDKSSKRKHRFPVFEEDVFNIWINRVANPKFNIVGEDADTRDKRIYKTYRVCDNHFIEECKIVESSRLKSYSLPTIDLPGFVGEPTKENSFYSPVRNLTISSKDGEMQPLTDAQIQPSTENEDAEIEPPADAEIEPPTDSTSRKQNIIRSTPAVVPNMPRYCCVPGCNNAKTPLHRFPVYDEEMFKVWIQRIAHPKFKVLTDLQIRQGYKVCERHFINECKVPGSKRLKYYSLPSVYVAGLTEEPSVENSFFDPTQVNIQSCAMMDHCYVSFASEATQSVPVSEEPTNKHLHTTSSSQVSRTMDLDDVRPVTALKSPLEVSRTMDFDEVKPILASKSPLKEEIPDTGGCTNTLLNTNKNKRRRPDPSVRICSIHSKEDDIQSELHNVPKKSKLKSSSIPNLHLEEKDQKTCSSSKAMKSIDLNISSGNRTRQPKMTCVSTNTEDSDELLKYNLLKLENAQLKKQNKKQADQIIKLCAHILNNSNFK